MQSNASGSCLQTCINFEGSIIPQLEKSEE